MNLPFKYERLYLVNHPGADVVVICMANEAYAPISKLTLPNFTQYCERHGYDLQFYAGAFHTDPMYPKTYGDKVKFELFTDVRGHYDVVVYLDIDSLFVDMEKRLPTNYEFLWTYGEGGPQSGYLVMQTTGRVEKTLRYVYEYAAANNNVRHGVIEPNGISDQDAMTALMHVPPFSHVLSEDCIHMNSAGLFYADDPAAQGHSRLHIVTARGGTVQQKLDALTPWKEGTIE
jgi:hypothetical protein